MKPPLEAVAARRALYDRLLCTVQKLSDDEVDKIIAIAERRLAAITSPPRKRRKKAAP